ncbi:hypothetical protein GCM10011344_30100 [Dokdonia pacifica]|uniref:Por secretion system C-terminal sorting domain-containing protein n=1 Tax=Dokdonia pacifica TaxID=1627892 RepID=A0A239BZL3_9FLAO|nr:T9SS type A sorting domain-containing protein [Dokdonia pacifica]GGG27287.1 hypothetical protein GCM10011344_30100 [Dokdonia pacifica]SNS13099.1 Por secretion system C-terminal sorting domain-containing protein [Dokdonia pacifica]
MKTYQLIIIACCVLWGNITQLRAQAVEEFEELDGEYCVYIPNGGSSSFGKAVPSSVFGQDFTPSGDLKALVIFVDFVGSDSGPDGNGGLHPLNRWPAGELPVGIFDSATNSLTYAHDDVSDLSPIGNPDTNAFSNISEYYYHMSEGSFRFLMEPLKDDNGNAILIQVDASQVNFYANINNLVFQEIATLFPNRDWASLGFDIRGDAPNFEEDQSATFANPQPDGQLDFSIIMYRNRNSWNPHPVANGGPSPASTGIAGIGGNFTVNNSFTAREGFTYVQTSTNRGSAMALFLHELGHNFIDLSHTSLANQVHGEYFHATNNWGMMNFAQGPSISNAWERWYNGWIDIEHDVNNATDNGTYILNDYMSSGDVMRLKLPRIKDQFLWLTNRSDATNPFYNRAFNSAIEVVDDVVISRINDTDPRGLFGFFERVAPQRSDVDRFEFGANGIKVMSGKGYYDLKLQEAEPTTGNRTTVNLLKDLPNPYGEEGEFTGYRFDVFDIDGVADRINYNRSSNSTAGNSPDKRNEHGQVINIDNQNVFSRKLLNSQLPDRKYSVFTNPPITNFIQYSDTQDVLSPVILHSLSFISQTIGNQVSITVNYDDGHIEDDFRMTGNIFLPSNEDIVLDTNVTLTVNRSGTNNKRNKDTNGTYINETVFIAAANASFESSNDSTVILDEASTTIFEEDSELIMGSDARIIIRGGALLCIKTTDVTLDPTARIIVEDGFLNISSGIDISANVEGSIFPFPTIANNITFCNSSITGPIHLHSIYQTNTGNVFCGNDVTVDVSDDVRLTSEQLIVIEPGFEAVPGSFFEAEIRTEIPQDCDIEFFFGVDGEPGVNGFKGRNQTFNNLQNGKSLAISVYPNPSKDIFNVEIMDAKGPFTYQLKNLSGVTLLEDQTSTTNFRIDAKHLKKGVYVLMVSNSTLSTGYKIIKF